MRARPEHKEAIGHINEKLAKHGMFSFVEVNKRVGMHLLSFQKVMRAGNPTAKHVLELLESGYVPIPMNQIKKSGKTRVRSGGRSTYCIVEGRLAPYVAKSQIAEGMGNARYHPMVTALLELDPEKEHHFFDLRKRGVRMLINENIIAESRAKDGSVVLHPSGKKRRFAIRDPESAREIIAAVRRSIELQENVWK